MSKLVDGLILAGTDCPFKIECGDYGKNHCKHTGTEHKVDFSCGIARAWDITVPRKERVDVGHC